MRELQDRVSVIMPAYNAARYLEESVSSVLAQTWQNLELIIIEDASQDETWELANTLAKRDERIRILRNPNNLGAARSRNRGVQAAKGEWIAFLDSDDVWKPEKLTEQLAFAHHRQAVFTFTGSAFMDADGQCRKYCLTVPEKVGYRQLLKQNIISCSSVLIRRSLILEYPMEHSGFLHEDFAVWLRILKEKHLYAYGLNQPLLIYRVSSASSSGNKWKAAQMTFRVYHYIGLPLAEALYYWLCYTKRSFFKYRNLKKKQR